MKTKAKNTYKTIETNNKNMTEAKGWVSLGRQVQSFSAKTEEALSQVATCLILGPRKMTIVVGQVKPHSTGKILCKYWISIGFLTVDWLGSWRRLIGMCLHVSTSCVGGSFIIPGSTLSVVARMVHVVEEWVHICQPCQESLLPYHRPQFIHGRQYTHHGLSSTLTLLDLSRDNFSLLLWTHFQRGPSVGHDICGGHLLLKALVYHPRPARHHHFKQKGKVYFWWIPEIYFSQHDSTYYCRWFRPSTNRQAEGMMCTTKDALCRIVQGNWNQRLADFLLQQDISPYTVTGKSPEKSLMNCHLMSLLDWLHPDLTTDWLPQQEAPKAPWSFQLELFITGTTVMAWNDSDGPNWISTRMTGATSPILYMITMPDRPALQWHVDQLQCRGTNHELLLDSVPALMEQDSGPRLVRSGLLLPAHTEAVMDSAAWKVKLTDNAGFFSDPVSTVSTARPAKSLLHLQWMGTRPC